MSSRSARELDRGTLLAGVVILLFCLPAVRAGPASTGSLLETGSIRSLIEKGALEAAERRTRDLIASLDREGKQETAEAAEALDLLLQVLDLRSPVASRALTVARRAADLRRRLDPVSPAFALSLENLGRWLHRSGLEQESRKVHREALILRERILEPGHPSIAVSLNSLGASFARSGDWVVGRSYYERSLATFDRSSGLARPEARIALFNLAELLENMGDYTAVKGLYERLLEDLDRRADPSPLGRVRALSWICQMDHRLGDDARARISYFEARELWESAHAQDGPVPGVGFRELANTAARLGTAARAAGEVEDARRFYLRSVEVREGMLGRDHPETSWDLRRLAETLHESGDSAGARPFIDRACRIQPEDTPGDRATLACCLALQSAIMRRMGEAGSAREVSRRARSLGESTLGAASPELLPIVFEQARVSLSLGDFNEARRHALGGEASARRFFLRTASGLSHGEALRFEEARVSGLDIALSSLTAPPDGPTTAAVQETWDAVIRSRGLTLDELIARRRITSAARMQGLNDLVKRLEADRSRLAHVAARGPAKDSVEDFAETVRSLMHRQESTERELAARSAPFRRLLDQQEVGWALVVEAMPRDAALVAYVRYTRSREVGGRLTENPGYLAFVKNASDGKPQVVPLGDASAIESLVGRWRERVAAPPRNGLGFDEERDAGELAAAGNRLREAIWDPVEKRLGRERMVLVVLDGELHRINLAALPAPDGRYLVESERVVHHIASERDLAGPGATRTGAGLLAVGAPEFDTRPIEVGTSSWPSLNRGGSFAGIRSTPFRPLIGARLEVEEIAARWREAGGGPGADPVVLVGRNATEAALKSLAPGRRVIHLATHGFFDGAPVADPRAGRRAGVLDSNPLLATGLALAGANERSSGDSTAESGDDGILLGEEVLSLDLTGVEWVVLSACGTGLGPVQPREGVHDLGRSFQGAGAATVITTLWEVEDESTRAWMKGLYRARLAGRSTAESFRQASLDVIEEGRTKGRPYHPYYWGGFVAAGDWR
ncbi:MAG TPA: CHAT domain-containing tetratricopeptide repeat protein [Candidatus Polarisedimenticolia bacterium]|jgi:CHAT domain-containing protein/tetratricopeptide (TPR) repeat protein